MITINSIKEGQRVRGVFFCKQKTYGVTKNGKEYSNIVFRDKTGNIEGKIWELNSPGIREFEPMTYVEISADALVFNGAMQLSVKEISPAEPGSYDPSDYMPTTEKDIEVMYKELLKLIDKVTEPHYNALLTEFFVKDEEFIKRFKSHSAAKTIHHGFIGGLLEHTLSVACFCDFIADKYDYLNRNLLLTAAICHDIGKIYELSEFPENDYTDAGQLLGHIVIGSEMVSKKAEKIEKFPIMLLRELKHCILAHHGKLEFGSPKKPALAEALALSYADDLDAKLQTFKEAVSVPQAQDGSWLGLNKMLDSNIRKTE